MADSNLPRPAKTALAADDTSDTTIKKRRLRCLESRRLKMEFKRRHIESLQHELTLHTTTSYDTNSLPALPSLSTSSVIESTPESSPSSSSIVVSLPKSARQSARKMAKDPAAATQVILKVIRIYSIYVFVWGLLKGRDQAEVQTGICFSRILTMTLEAIMII